MISRNFFKRVLLLYALAVVPFDAAQSAVNAVDTGEMAIYGKVFQLSKVSGESNFMNAGSTFRPVVGEAASKLLYIGAGTKGGLTSGFPIGEFRPTHAFSLLGGGFALGYKADETRFELEAIVNVNGSIADSAESSFYGLAEIAASTEEALVKGATHAAVGPMKLEQFSYAAVVLNVYHDFEAGNIMKPYSGIGVGVAHVWFELNAKERITANPFVVQAKIGAHFDVPELKKMNVIPYIGYTGTFFSEKKSDALAKVTVQAMKADGAEDSAKEVAKAIAKFAPVSKHIMHHIELGFVFPLDA